MHHAMIRTQVYLTKTEKLKINQLAKKTGYSQSELMREAIDFFITHLADYTAKKQAVLQKARGLWQHRKDLPDFTTLRQEWDRDS